MAHVVRRPMQMHTDEASVDADYAKHAFPANRSTTRRAFIAAAGAFTMGITASGCRGPEDEDSRMGEADGTDPDAAKAQTVAVYATCSPECQHHLLKGMVRNGKLQKVVPAEVNEGRICARGMARVETCNSPARLIKPMLRTGPKGSGEFEPIDWEEAFDRIEHELRRALHDGGPSSVLHLHGSGNFSALTHDRPFGVLGTWLGGFSQIAGNICCAGTDWGLTPILGRRRQTNRNQLAETDYMIVWGNNPAVTLGGYFDRLLSVVDRGGTLCVVDPLLTETADHAEEHLQPIPGSDAALALAMLKVIIDENLYDEEFLLEHTTAPFLIDPATGEPLLLDPKDPQSFALLDKRTHAPVGLDAEDVHPCLSAAGLSNSPAYVTVFDLIKGQADLWGEEEVEAECGVHHADIARIACAFASAPRAIIVLNMGGFQRTENGVFATASIVYLALFCGHIGHAGDGIYDVGGAADLIEVEQAFERDTTASEPEPIPFQLLARQMLAKEPRRIEFVWNDCGNPASQYPNASLVRKAFEHVPFMVTCDLFMTTTALWSDLVLPVTAVFETPNVTASVRSSVVQICEAGVVPPGEARTDLQIVAELARRFGVEGVFDEPPRTYIERILEPMGISYERLATEKGVNLWEGRRDWIPYKGGAFPTQTGRAELWVRMWKDEGFSPVACHMRPVESMLDAHGLADLYPLAAVQVKTRTSVHTSFRHLELLRALDGDRPVVLIHPIDATARDVANGDTVIVYNDRGEHRCRAHVTERIRCGVVALQNGWDGPSAHANSSSNVTSDRYDTLGHVHCCNSTLVDLRRDT